MVESFTPISYLYIKWKKRGKKTNPMTLNACARVFAFLYSDSAILYRVYDEICIFRSAVVYGSKTVYAALWPRPLIDL